MTESTHDCAICVGLIPVEGRIDETHVGVRFGDAQLLAVYLDGVEEPSAFEAHGNGGWVARWHQLFSETDEPLRGFHICQDERRAWTHACAELVHGQVEIRTRVPV